MLGVQPSVNLLIIWKVNNMNIKIISIGKAKNYFGEDMVLEYTSRISHYASIEWLFLNNSNIEEESEKILKNISDNSFIITLDERGKQLSSIEFSKFLEKKINESVREIVFIIGGSYGIGDKIRRRSDFILSLSSFVFPHEMVRSIISEQIYRAFTIMKGEKYHHE